jgi:hypothetical protein
MSGTPSRSLPDFILQRVIHEERRLNARVIGNEVEFGQSFAAFGKSAG